MRSNKGLILTLVLLIPMLWYAFVIGPSQDCARKAAMFVRPYVFHPLDGCWIQQENGNWARIDQVVPVQP